MKNKTIFLQPICLGLIIFLFILQVFPPLWCNDVTSLRHFFLSIFDIIGIGFIVYSVFKNDSKIINPLNFTTMKLFGILILWMLLSIIWSLNGVESLAVANRWFLVFVCAFVFINLLCNNPKLFHIIVYCAMLIAVVNVLTCIISYYYLDCATYPKKIPAINGGYGNKNIFAVCLMFKLPFLYYALFRYKKWLKIIASVLIVAICFCLPIISTRSAFVCLALNIIIMIIYSFVYFFRFKTKSYLIKTSLIVVLLLGGFVLGSFFVTYNYKHSEHKQKNEFDVTQRIKETGTGRSSKVRLIIWRNTSQIIKEKPLFGWGAGNHKLAIMKVETPQKANFIVSDHAHNDFLEMFSELGLVGLLLYLSVYLSVFIAAIRIIFSRKTKEPYRLIALLSLMLVITYMNDAMFNFPNERATPQIYLALSLSLIVFAKSKMMKQRQHSTKFTKPIFVFICLLTISATYVEAMHFYSSKLQLERIVCYNNKNKNQVPPEYWEKHFPCLPNVDESTRPIAINIANMYALQKYYRKAIDIIINDNSNPYIAMKEFSLASWYSKMGKKDSALFFADSCLRMKPKFYNAAVIKINIYNKEGNNAKSKEIIEDFLKVDSLNYRPWCDLMNIYIAEKNYEKAFDIWTKAHATVPRSKKIFNKKEKIIPYLTKE
ncbi:MAG: O-antigen ligase family protein [Bacteroidales bacterium]|nr:O-antigen ligase family protein [Bacteroidales bacterium]